LQNFAGLFCFKDICN